MRLTFDERLVVPACPPLATIYSRWDLGFALPFYKRSSSINAIGAMGTNRLGVPIGNNSSGVPVINDLQPYGYYSIYNQRHTSKWVGHAVALEDLVSLEAAIKAMEYGFKFQDYQGKNLLGLPSPQFDGRFPAVATSITTATMFDVVGNMSFFLADLQLSLHTLASSTWFMQSGTTAGHRARLNALLPYMKIAADWLLDPTPTAETNNVSRSNFLLSNDTINPNRILQQGLVFYGFGKYFNDPEMVKRGEYIIQYGLKYHIRNYRDAVRPITGIVTKAGYTDRERMAFSRTLEYLEAQPLGWDWFCETGGSDSSYHATNMLQLLRLYAIIPTTDTEFRRQVWSAIEGGYRWMMRLLQADGDVSLQDNTRVYNGGETYQGKPKRADYLEWLFVLSFYGGIVNRSSVIADSVTMLLSFTKKTLTLNAPMSLYTAGRNLMLAGGVDYESDLLRVALVQIAGTRNAPYTVDLGSHQFLSSIPVLAFADTSDILINTAFNGGVLTADPIVCDRVQSMPDLVQVGGIVVWKDTGDRNTSPLLAYSSNVTGLPYGPLGNDILVDFYGVNNHVFTVQ